MNPARIRKLKRLGLVVAGGTSGWAFGADSAQVHSIANIFKPLSAPAEAVYEISLLALLVCAGIFLVVGSLLAYAVVKFRSRPGDEGTEPPQIYGSNQLEMAWTAIPILIVFVLVLVTARTTADVQNHKLPDDSLKVRVVGRFTIRITASSPPTNCTFRSVPAISDGLRPCDWSRPMSFTAFGCRNWRARPT